MDSFEKAVADLDQEFPGCLIELRRISTGWFCRLSPVNRIAKCDPVALEPSASAALIAATAILKAA